MNLRMHIDLRRCDDFFSGSSSYYSPSARFLSHTGLVAFEFCFRLAFFSSVVLSTSSLFFLILNILWTTHKFDREQQQYELQQAQNVVCIYVRIAIATSTFHYAVRIMGRTKKCYAIRFRTHFWPSSSKKKIWKRTIIYVVAGL